MRYLTLILLLLGTPAVAEDCAAFYREDRPTVWLQYTPFNGQGVAIVTKVTEICQRVTEVAPDVYKVFISTYTEAGWSSESETVVLPDGSTFIDGWIMYQPSLDQELERVDHVNWESYSCEPFYPDKEPWACQTTFRDGSLTLREKKALLEELKKLLEQLMPQA